MKNLVKILTVAVALCLIFTSCSDEKPDTRLEGITLSESSKILRPTESIDLSVSFFPSNTPDKGLEWTSSNEDVEMIMTVLT